MRRIATSSTECTSRDAAISSIGRAVKFITSCFDFLPPFRKRSCNHRRIAVAALCRCALASRTRGKFARSLRDHGFQRNPRAVTKLQTSPTTYSFARKLSHRVDRRYVVQQFLPCRPIPLRVDHFEFGAGLHRLSCNKILHRRPPSGYTSIISSFWFYPGNLIAEAFSEVKRSPQTIVRQVHGRQDSTK
jgi:hypothetical protein